MIKEYTIRNEFLEASFINLGAAITKLVDLQTSINIILSHNDLEAYKTNPGSMNAIIGRHAGRIQDFYLNGNLVTLPKTNNNNFQLHGGKDSFMFKFFDAEVQDDAITFTYNSPANEGGFPGNVKFSITYKLVSNELQLIYEAVSDELTLMNFTNHAYYNLNVDKNQDILNHVLYLNSDYYLELAENLLPLRKVPVDDTPMDFRTPKPIGQDIFEKHPQLIYGKGYDLPFIVNKQDKINHVASVFSPESNLILDILSDQDVVVFYAGCQMDETMVLNDGIKGKQYLGFCLELQGVPNSPSIEEFKDRNIYQPGEVYRQFTIWRISHKN